MSIFKSNNKKVDEFLQSQGGENNFIINNFSVSFNYVGGGIGNFKSLPDFMKEYLLNEGYFCEAEKELIEGKIVVIQPTSKIGKLRKQSLMFSDENKKMYNDLFANFFRISLTQGRTLDSCHWATEGTTIKIEIKYAFNKLGYKFDINDNLLFERFVVNNLVSIHRTQQGDELYEPLFKISEQVKEHYLKEVGNPDEDTRVETYRYDLARERLSKRRIEIEQERKEAEKKRIASLKELPTD